MNESAAACALHHSTLVPQQLSLCSAFPVLSDEQDILVLVNFNSHEYPWFWPFSFPIFKLHYDIKLNVVDTPQGKKFATQVGFKFASTACSSAGTVALHLQLNRLPPAGCSRWIDCAFLGKDDALQMAGISTVVAVVLHSL